MKANKNFPLNLSSVGHFYFYMFTNFKNRTNSLLFIEKKITFNFARYVIGYFKRYWLRIINHLKLKIKFYLLMLLVTLDQSIIKI